jgi:hypothetical protein
MLEDQCDPYLGSLSALFYTLTDHLSKYPSQHEQGR